MESSDQMFSGNNFGAVWCLNNSAVEVTNFFFSRSVWILPSEMRFRVISMLVLNFVNIRIYLIENQLHLYFGCHATLKYPKAVCPNQSLWGLFFFFFPRGGGTWFFTKETKWKGSVLPYWENRSDDKNVYI